MKNIIFILIILFSFTLSSQKKANNKLESPIDFPIILSGNFGELRSSGFHSGIDIKTKGKEGIEIRQLTGSRSMLIKNLARRTAAEVALQSMYSQTN